MCVCMCVQSCSTLQPHGHGIFQAGILEWVGIRIFQRVFPTQGSKPRLPWQKDSLSTAPPGKSRSTYLHTYLQFTCLNQDINNVHLFYLVDVSLKSYKLTLHLQLPPWQVVVEGTRSFILRNVSYSRFRWPYPHDNIFLYPRCFL